MIVIMQSGSSPEQVAHVVSLVREFGLQDHVIVGTDRTVIAAIGDKRNVDKSAIESAPGVDKIVPILAPYKVASREVRAEPSVIPIGEHASVGGSKLAMIAGPCSVESREQLLEIAHAVKESGAVGLRGGAFKPRTNPYQFQGLGEKGLELLAEAREATGLAVVTEVMSIDQVELVSRYADVLQIGTRNMHNFNLLMACGESNRTVILKRGWSATLDEFLLAAEYIISAGNPNVVLCERGIRTHETYVRNTLPLAIIPAVKRESHLPIIIDPSQGTGHAYMVPAMCRAAVAAGADGLLVEVHHDPEHAMTDGAQSLTPEAWAKTVAECKAIGETIGRSLS
ncbi:MAG: 3-deoxy-7-phosphoheptulonate synthase [Phycisphaerae bacterium]